jgi:hypothetical protein
MGLSSVAADRALTEKPKHFIGPAATRKPPL